jgi:hypothetical protein
VAAVLLGMALAAIAYFLFFLAPLAGLNLIVWAIVAFAIGFFDRTWRMTIVDCAIVGFSIVFSYSILGYQGAGSLLAAIPAFALIAVAGAAGMTAAGAISHLVRSRMRRAGP